MSEPEVKILPRQYFGYNSRPTLLSDPFLNGDYISEPITQCRCSRKGCKKIEIIEEKDIEKKMSARHQMLGIKPTTEKKLVVNRFLRCKTCYSKYCSRECLIADHQEGEHKKKCSLFSLVVKTCKKELCPSCFEKKMEFIADPYPNGKCSSEVYIPCKNCKKKELLLDEKFSEEVVEDRDLYRVFFS